MEFDSRLIELDWGMSRLYEKILPVSTPDIASPDRHDAWLESDGDRTRRLLTEVLDREEDRL
ncbi:MAG: hypothetical protein GTO63_04640, partial [Anaerolineae bacterium]|nr:hypothetical protein [Anaerolineae bacterium]NIN94292.1 hypothetical protein [Anaerolineae bacterium]